MKTWLLDTGPLVAFLDGKDREHELVSEQLENFSGRLITTSAVVVEAMHFVSESEPGPSLLVKFLERSRTEVIECTALTQLREAAALMRKYFNIPMDFADATLVLASDSLGSGDICTLDRRGFRVYRTPGGKPFHLVLDQ